MLDSRKRRSAQSAIKKFLSIYEIDLADPEYKETPARIVRAYEEMLSGNLADDLPFKFTTFDTKNDQLVVISPISFSSLCPHHFLPYFGEVRVGYLPNGKVAGLSKFPRLVRHLASRPLKQEDLTESIAAELEKKLDPLAVLVSITATHTCMRIRGAKDPCADTTTSAVKGPKGLAVVSEFYSILSLTKK